jgi:hypothetical protein
MRIDQPPSNCVRSQERAAGIQGLFILGSKREIEPPRRQEYKDVLYDPFYLLYVLGVLAVQFLKMNKP